MKSLLILFPWQKSYQKSKRNDKDTDEIWMAITNNSRIVETNAEESRDVGITHASVKSKNRNFSLADAFVLATARKLKARVVTGDADFKNITEAIML